MKKCGRLLIVPGLFLLCYSCNIKRQKMLENRYPNIVYILADDLGYGDLQSLNSKSEISTPNMDKIVDEGIHFTDAHSNSAVCTPTRYGIITGRYAFRTRLKKGVLWGYSSSLIEPGRETVASFLKKNGYQTACIGKWHLGLDWPGKDSTKMIPDVKKVTRGFDDNVDYTQTVKGGPSDHGFDYSLIIPASLDMSPYCYVRNGKVVEPAISYTEGKSEEVDGRGVFWRAGKMSPDFDFNQVLPTFLDTSCWYINEHANTENPFFLYLALPAPHTPWLPLDEYGGQSNAGKYGDYVAMVDDMIGRVLKALERSHAVDNTLVIITSDNGSDWNPDDIEETGHRSNYIFRGRKADIYEAGHRIPFIARYSGIIPAGAVSDQVMCTTDLLRTLAGMLDKPLPEGAGEDSFNMWPAFLGDKLKLPGREVTIHHSYRGFYSIRKGKWKYTPRLGSGGFTTPKEIIPKEGEAPSTLYDIENDPAEQHNLYFEYPDVVKELSELLEKYKCNSSWKNNNQ